MKTGLRTRRDPAGWARQVSGFAAIATAIVLSTLDAGAQTAGVREVPAKAVPVPDTVSPQMQKLIAAPLTPTWNVIPKTAEEWKAQVDAGAAATMRGLPALREALRVKVEPTTIDGVKAHVLTPEVIPPENRNGKVAVSTKESAGMD